MKKPSKLTSDPILVRFAIVAFVLGLILNWFWIFILNFDKTPLLTINGILVANIIMAFLVAKRVPLAGAMLIGMGILVVLLGFALLKGIFLSV